MNCNTMLPSKGLRHLDSGGLGAGLEGVGQAALAAVLAVLVEGHLKQTCEKPSRMQKEGTARTKIPAPHSAEGHSRRRRLILPSESTL